MISKDVIDKCRIEPGSKWKLSECDTDWTVTKTRKNLGKAFVKERAAEILTESQEQLTTAQELLYADNNYALLIVFQAMDAAGKDSTIKHVMSGVNPQGCQVFSFKQPSAEELDHTFLWRHMRCLPEHGRIGIFNRSYYEDVLVVKVHPELIENRSLPPGKRGAAFWKGRYDDINAFERHLTRNGTVILKFFLNISKDEQKSRFLDRLDRPEKNWKFSVGDLAERARWDDYQTAYEQAITATSTKWAPWYVIPADQKWAARAIVADIITTQIQSLNLSFPQPTDAKLQELVAAREQLMNE